MPPKRPEPLSDEFIAPSVPVLLGSTHLGAPAPLKSSFGDFPVASPAKAVETPMYGMLMPATPSPLWGSHKGISRCLLPPMPAAGAPLAQPLSYSAPPPVYPRATMQDLAWPPQSQQAPPPPQPPVLSISASLATPVPAAPPAAVQSQWKQPPPLARVDSIDVEEEDDDDEDDEVGLRAPLAQFGNAPRPPPGAIHPSVGSEGHASGACKRCCFFPRGRCANGYNCEFCHYEHEKRKRKNKAKKKSSTPVGKSQGRSSASTAVRSTGISPLPASAANAAPWQEVAQPMAPAQSLFSVQPVGPPAPVPMGQNVGWMPPMHCYQPKDAWGAPLSTTPPPASNTMMAPPQPMVNANTGYQVIRLPPAMSQQQPTMQAMGQGMPLAQQRPNYLEVAPPPPPMHSPRLNRLPSTTAPGTSVAHQLGLYGTFGGSMY